MQDNLLDDLDNIFTFLEKKDFAECTIEKGDLKVTIKRAAAFAATDAVSTKVFAMPTATPAISHTTTDSTGYLVIKSPMIGTFYRQPKPGSPVFVQEGDVVQKGQVLCVIEAMKLFNEIESDFQGKIVKILVEDASPVQYDQPLFWIAP